MRSSCRPTNAVLAMSATQWLTLKRVLLGTLDKFHNEHPDLPGIGFEPLRMQLRRDACPRLVSCRSCKIWQNLET